MGREGVSEQSDARHKQKQKLTLRAGTGSDFLKGLKLSKLRLFFPPKFREMF